MTEESCKTVIIVLFAAYYLHNRISHQVIMIIFCASFHQACPPAYELWILEYCPSVSYDMLFLPLPICADPESTIPPFTRMGSQKSWIYRVYAVEHIGHVARKPMNDEETPRFPVSAVCAEKSRFEGFTRRQRSARAAV